jgi:hypothetical protein
MERTCKAIQPGRKGQEGRAKSRPDQVGGVSRNVTTFLRNKVS